VPGAAPFASKRHSPPGRTVGHNRTVELPREAERYCSLIESADSFECEAFAAELAEALARLLSAASGLAAVAPTDSEPAPSLAQEEWSKRFAAIQQTLGEWDAYWTTPAPYGADAQDAVMLPLADDLADIWRDLKPGLLALERGAAPNNVTWEWRFGFYSHWGRHATEALRAIHARLADNGGPLRGGD
jgi:hypothetical protein